MRIKIYSDNKILMDTSLEGFKLLDPKTSQEVNKAGKLTFTIYHNNPHFDYIAKMKSIITVYEDDIEEPLFRGRVSGETEGFYGEKQVTCEGELAFLNDSIIRPYEFTGSPAELFAQYISIHNSQVDSARQFILGNVTVTDPNNYITRSNSEYTNTWTEINNKLIKLLGGYLWVRHEGGVNYIDYLEDFDVLSNQSIDFGKNLLDLKKNIRVEKFATALIPLGAKLKDDSGNDTGERLTIKAVNDDVDFVYNEEAVAEHGYITTTQIWDDVTDVENLKRKGQAFIDDSARFVASINVTAADLNGASIEGEPVEVNSFRIGRYVKINTQPHSLVNQNFMVSKLNRELLKPEATKLVLGTSYKSLTEKQLESKGIQGERGPAGKDGADGVNGKDGVDGKDGKQGIQGEKGDKGDTGAQGEKGEKGDKGDTGAQGIQGIKGDKGDTGAAGKDGADGRDAAIQSDTAPSDKTYMWLDTSVEPPLLKRWNGSTWIIVNDQSATIALLEQRFTANIKTTENSITQTLTESYYTKDATDALISSESSQWMQTAKGFEMQFNTLSKDLNEVSIDKDARFREISQYIRFEDGNIILGKSGSELILRIENDRISFLQNNTEVAYFTDRKLYVTDGEYTNSLKLGKFAFIPRTNGNLSFKKIVD